MLLPDPDEALLLRAGPSYLGATPRTSEFIAFKAREEAKTGEAETRCSRLFPGRLRGARIALQRCPSLPGDKFRIGQNFLKTNRTFVCAIDGAIDLVKIYLHFTGEWSNLPQA